MSDPKSERIWQSLSEAQRWILRDVYRSGRCIYSGPNRAVASSMVSMGVLRCMWSKPLQAAFMTTGKVVPPKGGR